VRVAEVCGAISDCCKLHSTEIHDHLFIKGACAGQTWKNCAWEQIGKKTLHGLSLCPQKLDILALPIGIKSELFVLLAMAGEARADCQHISCSTYGLGSSNSSNLIFLSNL